jgi:hypothetical protein
MVCDAGRERAEGLGGLVMMLMPSRQLARAAQLRAFNPDSRAAVSFEPAARVQAEQDRLVADYARRLEVAPEA